MKQILLLLLFPCFAMAQYTGNANQKITLGEQTTADGLVYRGVASADTIRKPSIDTMAFILLDTTTNILWQYKKSTNNAWTRLNLLPSDLGTNVATFLATPTSANLAAAVTNETGSGALVFATQPVFTNTIGVGSAIASTSGSGITFPNTQSASTNANTLDDYEEGTWTPTVIYNTVNTPTFSNQTGRYTKIGSIVQITFQLSFNENGSVGSYIVIGNLPFTVLNTGGARAVVAMQSFGLTSLPINISLTGKVDNNTTNIELQLNDNTGTFITNLYTDNDQDIYGFVIYEVN